MNASKNYCTASLYFLLLFQSVPCFISQSCFKRLDLVVIPFIPFLKLQNCQNFKKPIETRREWQLHFTKFKLYYWTTHLTTLACWRKGPNFAGDSFPAWLRIEGSLCKIVVALLNSTIRS